MLEQRIGEAGVLLIVGGLGVGYVVLAVWVIRRWSRTVAPRRRSVVAKATMVSACFAPGLVVHHGLGAAPWWLALLSVFAEPSSGPMGERIVETAVYAGSVVVVPVLLFWLGCLVVLVLVRMAKG